MDAACLLKKEGNEITHIFTKVGGRKIELLKHIFALYGIPLILSEMLYLLCLLYAIAR